MCRGKEPAMFRDWVCGGNVVNTRGTIRDNCLRKELGLWLEFVLVEELLFRQGSGCGLGFFCHRQGVWCWVGASINSKGGMGACAQLQLGNRIRLWVRGWG